MILSPLAVGLPPPPTLTAESVVPGDQSLTVVFEEPKDLGGLPITGYAILIEPGSLEVKTTSTQCIIPGLATGKRYRVTVVAVNGVGRSPPSNQIEETAGTSNNLQSKTYLPIDYMVSHKAIDVCVCVWQVWCRKTG